ncbi:sensor domain-containing protein [Prescottella agglutinans]|uniref:sensor domain-containing protein n=1 Tax=Prescottella agglutinans TaxID=1644129 RepID=UPI003D9630CA
MSLRTRVAPRLVLGSALLGVGAFVVGCATAVEGAARPVDVHAAGSRPLDEMLLEPSAFPPRYPAVVLPPQAVSQAAPDLTGIAPGARVEPAGCKPPTQDYGPDGTAMVVGTDNTNRSTITIELVRVDTPLSEFGAQIVDCPEVTATRNGVEAVVRTALTPPPQIGADETLALRRSVSSGWGEQAVTQSMVSLIAQIDGVRVQATAMSFGDVTDPAVLGALFASAVEKVRAG